MRQRRGDDREALRQLGFYDQDQELIAQIAVELGGITAPDLRVLAERMLGRIRELSPTYRNLARTALTRLTFEPARSALVGPDRH